MADDDLAAKGRPTDEHVAAAQRALENVAAKAEQRARGSNGSAPALGTSPAVSPAGLFIDWTTFWDEADEEEWVWKNVLARGRGHAVYAVHKGGKSLLALYMVADMATDGGMSCLYLDYEMTAADVRERLRDMGCGPESDLSHLHYALLPTLPALDTEEGGIALAGIVDKIVEREPDRHVVVVIDTISRAVWGEENSADTFRLFYVHTGLRLKQRGVTWLRLDHGGKDAGKGQRGSSGKGDDVDVVWRLTPTENGIRLQRELSRMNWVPESVSLLKRDFPLCYLPAAYDWPEGTANLAVAMDRLGLPLDASSRTAGLALREIDEGRQNTLVLAALKYRRERAAEAFVAPGKHPGKHPLGDDPQSDSGSTGEQDSFSLGSTAGSAAKQEARESGKQSPPIYRGTASHPTPSGDDNQPAGEHRQSDYPAKPDKRIAVVRQAAEIVVNVGAASANLLMKRLELYEAEACSLLDMLEAAQIVGPLTGRARPVLAEFADIGPLITAYEGRPA